MNDSERQLQPHELHLRNALEHARRLTESHQGPTRVDWSAPAAHVGDLSVLALALRD